MARTRSSAKAAGTSFETGCAKFLTEQLHTKVTRMPKNGNRDIGDLYGVEFAGEPMVVECKNPGKDSSWLISGWWKETLTEAKNMDTEYGVLVVKRYRKNVPEALCVVDSDMWGKLLGGKVLEPHSVPSVSFTKWLELIDEHGSIETTKRGTTGSWIVFPLHKLVEIINLSRIPQEVTMSIDELKSLRIRGSLSVYDSKGLPVNITLEG